MSAVINFLKNRRRAAADTSSDDGNLPYISDQEEKELERKTNFLIRNSKDSKSCEKIKTIKLRGKKRKSRHSSQESVGKKFKKRSEDKFIESKINVETLDQDKMENRIIRGKLFLS
jgi:hypothetical protein